MNNVLADPPKYFRAPVSRGAQPRVEREGGYRGAGIIHGVSVITQGEALGHGLWIDQAMLEQVHDAINASNNGVKSRFTHPGLSGDGLGKHVGRIKDAEMDGQQVLADQHFIQAAHRTPDGNLAGYLMDLAEEDPEAYGLSIVFGLDEGEMKRCEAQHTNSEGDFTSPDPLNVNNLPHARLSELRAVDAVDEPAANPNGLFHREQDIVQQAEALASYALGISSNPPETTQLGLDADRTRGFVARFLANHNLELRNKTMSEEIITEPVEEKTEPVETPETPTTEVATSNREEAARFREKFGDRGAVWFAEGLSYDEAFNRELEVLRNEISELKTKLAARPLAGEETPVGFDANEKTRGGFASKIRVK